MDWCRKSVIAAALDLRTFVQAERALGQRIEISSFRPFTTKAHFEPENPGIDTESDLRYAQATLIALQRDGIKIPGMRIRFLRAHEVQRSRRKASPPTTLEDLPVKKGLSSSAAVCVAVSAAADMLSREKPPDPGKEFSKEALSRYADLAYTAERKILGVNCGQMDQYASAFGGLTHIDCTAEPAKLTPLKTSVELPLVIGDTGQQKDTPRILGWLGDRLKCGERDFMEGMENIVRIVEEAKKELQKTNPSRKTIGELMNQNQHYLAKYLKVSGDCPISPSRLDELIEAALEAGALGAKLSGSGGGGAMIALCEPESQRKIGEAIKKAGGQPLLSRVADQGLRTEHFSS